MTSPTVGCLTGAPAINSVAVEDIYERVDNEDVLSFLQQKQQETVQSA